MVFVGAPKLIVPGWWVQTVDIDGALYAYVFHETEIPRIQSEMEQN